MPLRRLTIRCLPTVLGGLCGLFAPVGISSAQVFTTKITDDRPGANACSDPYALPNPSADVNNMPQAEVALAVSDQGHLAAVAKDYRYAPIDDTTYNRRVWNGLYLSADSGQTWDNRLFENSNPDIGLVGIVPGVYGQQPGAQVWLGRQTDPVADFDRDGNLYTCALAYQPDPEGASDPQSPSAIVVSRLTPQGGVVPGSGHLLALEADPRLFNDKNWLVVDRTAPRESTVVVASWRLFVFDDSATVADGGYVAVSADGAASFGPPIRLPIPPEDVADSQFYQPLIGPDPATGRKTLYVVFRTVGQDFALAMHVIKAPIDGLEPGTAALHEHLARPDSWTYLPDRVTGLFGFGSDGYDGSFRFSSHFMPAVDRETGHLYAVAHAFEPGAQISRVVAVSSRDGGQSWTSPRDIDAPGRGYQIMSTVAVAGGVVSVLWYDSRHDPDFLPLSPIRGIDVYYAELDSELALLRVLRLTPQTQRADRPVFTRARAATSQVARPPMPHDMSFMRRPPGLLHLQPDGVQAASAQSCQNDRYGFIGDYIGLAADREFAYAAWCDLRDLSGDADVCAGHSCNGRRNQNVYFARIPK